MSRMISDSTGVKAVALKCTVGGMPYTRKFAIIALTRSVGVEKVERLPDFLLLLFGELKLGAALASSCACASRSTTSRGSLHKRYWKEQASG